MDLTKRLCWDLTDLHERKYYVYWLISQIPRSFGNRLRAKYLAKKFRSAGRNLQVCAGVRFRSMGNIDVGSNLDIGEDCYIQALGGVTIGDNVLIGPGVKIWSVNHIYKDKEKLIREQGLTKKSVVIGNDVWIAANAFILPGVKLPDGIVVAAGSVVVADHFQPYSILAGNPAKTINFRN